MLSVTLYEFKKRENSTKRPDGSETSRTHQAILKRPTSLLNPEITFDFGLKGNPSFYNYAYISDLGNRYYFIRDWTVEAGHLWTAHCEVDVLASWKVSIGESTQYVTRSSYAFNGKLVDELYPAIAQPSISLSTLDNPFVTNFSDGTYIVGIINSDSSGVGAVHYYAFDQTAFNNLCAYLLGDPSWTEISDISEDLTKALLNPMQYIVSCNWFPLKLLASSKLSSIQVGWWSIPVSGATLPVANIATAWGFLQIPKHPQASRGVYLNGAPYSKYQLFYPGVGNIAVDANLLNSYSTLGTLLQIDVFANTARLSLLGGNTQDSAPLAQYEAQVGLQVQLSQMSSSFFQNLGSGLVAAAQTGSALATGNYAGALNGAASMVGSVLNAQFPQLSQIGTNGSLLSLKSNIILRGEFYSVADEDNADRGRPYCKSALLSSLPGYQVVAHADLAIAGTSEENRRIKGYLESGYFFE